MALKYPHNPILPTNCFAPFVVPSTCSGPWISNSVPLGLERRPEQHLRWSSPGLAAKLKRRMCWVTPNKRQQRTGVSLGSSFWNKPTLMDVVAPFSPSQDQQKGSHGYKQERTLELQHAAGGGGVKSNWRFGGHMIGFIHQPCLMACNSRLQLSNQCWLLGLHSLLTVCPVFLLCCECVLARLSKLRTHEFSTQTRHSKTIHSLLAIW